MIGVGVNNDLGEVQGVLGEEEMKELKTQVRLINLPFTVDFSAIPAFHLPHLLINVKRNNLILQQVKYISETRLYENRWVKQ